MRSKYVRFSLCGIVGSIVLLLSTSFTNLVVSEGIKDNELELLIKIAREYRDGSHDVSKNLDRAAHFFQYVLEQSENPSPVTIAASDELYRLLLRNPHLKSKFSKWQLLSLAAEHGIGHAQHELATALGSGIFVDGLVPMDARRALLLEYSAALSGDALANMAMGYRFMEGIGVVKSCDRALPHYEYAANLAAEYIDSSVVTPTVERMRPTDFIASGGFAASWGRSLQMSRQEMSIELGDYYAHLADAGDLGAANILGTFYLFGSKNFPANQKKALHYLKIAADGLHPTACGILGYFLAKTYVKEDPSLHLGNYSLAHLFPVSEIVELLLISEMRNDVNGILGTGYIYDNGVGVEANATKALELYNKCFHLHADAGFYAGELRIRQFSKSSAASSSSSSSAMSSTTSSVLRSFDLSAAAHAYSGSSANGNVLATHRLGHMAARGMGTARSCETAVQAFKTVAERGPWMTAAANAYKLYHNRHKSTSSSSSSLQGRNKKSSSSKYDHLSTEFATSSSKLSASSTAEAARNTPLKALWELLPLAMAGVENAQFLVAFLVTHHAQELPNVPFTPPIFHTDDSRYDATESDSVTLEDSGDVEEKINDIRLNTSLVTAISESLWNDRLNLPELQLSQQCAAPSFLTSLQLSTTSSPTIISKTTISLASLLQKSARYRRRWHRSLHEQTKNSHNNQNKYGEEEEDAWEAEMLRRQKLSEIRALAMLGLSASQGNADALVMLGDFHYYGSASLVAAPDRAASFYQRAADLHHAKAIFNLGVMHEIGDGVAQDFHLAKRFYDMAAGVDTKARFPRDLALLVMDIHKGILSYVGGDNRLLSRLLDENSVKLLREAVLEIIRWLDFFSSESVHFLVKKTASWFSSPLSTSSADEGVEAEDYLTGISTSTRSHRNRHSQQQEPHHWWSHWKWRHMLEVVVSVFTDAVDTAVKGMRALEKVVQIEVIVIEQDEIFTLLGLMLLFTSLWLTKLFLLRRERLLFHV